MSGGSRGSSALCSRRATVSREPNRWTYILKAQNAAQRLNGVDHALRDFTGVENIGPLFRYTLEGPTVG